MEFIKGYEGRYSISRDGTLYSHLRNKILSPCYDSGGYLHIRLRKNGSGSSYKVHRLLAIQYISNPLNKSQINHINGIKDDNRLENLEWCTSQENVQHAFDTSLTVGLLGESNHFSKLNEKEVLEIYNLISD